MKPADQYRTALADLVERRKRPRFAARALRRAAARLGGDPATPVAVLDRNHVHGLIGAFLAGELDAAEVCVWAGTVSERLSYLHTGGGPLSAEIGYQSAIYNAVRLLADTQPQDIDAELLARASALLDCADLDPHGREWNEEEIAQAEAMINLAAPGMIGQARQGLETALLEADIRGIHDPHAIPIMLARGKPEPGQHRVRPLGEGEKDLASFELCGCTWMIRPGPASGVAVLTRVSLGRPADRRYRSRDSSDPPGPWRR
jgi:hypothetical protein